MNSYFGSGLRQDIWDRIDGVENILISGCGGGYDFIHSIPLFFTLKGKGKNVFLGNRTFSDIYNGDGEIITKRDTEDERVVCMAVTAETNIWPGSENVYFPEKYLCQWFKEEFNEDVTVYTMRGGLRKITEAYNTIIQRHGIQLVILIDGGNDSLMSGDEFGLGTPLEDMISIFAVENTGVSAVLACLGVGSDRYHGVSDCSTLRAIAELTESGGFLGCFSLLQTMPEVQGYFKASDYVESKMPQASIVGYYIRNSIIGKFGDYNKMDRTAHAKIFVNPLMGQYYFFDNSKVVQRIKFKEFIETTESEAEFMEGINTYRSTLNGALRREEIPHTGQF